MKCLLFLYGEKRTFDTASKFWNVLNIPNLDIVIHSPDTTGEFIGDTNLIEVHENDFSKLKTSKIFLHDRYEFRRKLDNSLYSDDFHVLHYSFRFLSNYLKSSPIYDYIIIGRLDSTLYIKNFEDIVNRNQNCIYPLQVGNGTMFIPDHTFFGSYKIMKKFVDEMPNGKNFQHDPHGAMSQYIYNNFEEELWGDYTPVHEDYTSIHIRPNMIKYFESYYAKFGKIKNVDDDYSKFVNAFITKYEYKLDIDYKKNYRDDWIQEYVFKKGELDSMYQSFLHDLKNNNLDSDSEIEGCTNNMAVNYNRYATIDDGTCVF